MTPENLIYLSIDSKLEMDKEMFKDRMALWEQLFPPQQLSYTLTPSQL
jgi:hypothetical protein